MRLVFVLLLLFASPAKTHAQSQLSDDIRTWAPSAPASPVSKIANPHAQAGSSLEDVGGDWVRRQIYLSTNGADEQFIADTNDTLDRFFGLNRDADEPSVARKPASTSAAVEDSWIKPRSFHVSKVGEFEVAFGANTRLHCDLVNGNELTLSKPIFQDIDLRLNHQNTLNSVQLKFNW